MRLMPLSINALKKQCLLLVVMCGLILFTAVAALAAEAVGKISSLSGRVDLLRGGRLPAVAAKVGDMVYVRDFVRTKSNARAEIRFSDGNVIRVAPRSRLDISEYAVKRDRRSFRLSRGRVEAVVSKQTAGSRTPRRFEITTPNAVAGVRGTWYFVFFDSNVTGIAVKDGVVYAYNTQQPDREVEIPAGFTTTIRNGSAPGTNRPATESELTLVRGLSRSGGSGGQQLAGLLWVPDGNPPPNFVAPLSDTNPAVLGPAVEVGVVNMVWSSGTFTELSTSSYMNNVHFLASSAGGMPTAFKTDTNSISMDYINVTASPVGKTAVFSGGAASAVLTINSWNMTMTPGSWSASVSGSGNINGSFVMNGTASGGGAQYGVGIATGTASGTASPMPP